MAFSRLNLTRDQLATFLSDAEQIKQFERLFAVASNTSLNDQDAHFVFAGPTSGAAAPPSFRLLVKNDIPQLDYVESVGATAPITSTGGFNPVIGITGTALTRVSDTNVVLTLGGSPSNALLAPTSITVSWSGTLAITRGGTGASNASDARDNLSAAARGANNDITSLTGLTTPLSVAQGGTGANTDSGARTNLGLGSGLSVTITTAQLTLAGTSGSMTFTNGILTAQVQAT